jgi:uncharacterized protein YdhG (YjbR/CyaY superfamily)
MFDTYLDGLDEAERAALQPVIDLVHELVPDAEEGRSYGVAAFRYRGKPLLGFAATAKHVSLYPFSPEALEAVKAELDGFSLSKGTVRFTPDKPIPPAILARMVQGRVAEIDGA